MRFMNAVLLVAVTFEVTSTETPVSINVTLQSIASEMVDRA
jgi:hypothetical protein